MLVEEYERIVQKYSNNIYRIIVSICRNTADAEDILQNVFLKLYIEKKNFESDEHIKRWLIVCAVNESKNMVKSTWKKRVEYLEDMSDGFTFESKEDSELYDAVRRLSARYSCVIHLFYYEGYAVKEIAKILSLKESTVLMRLKRGREKLKKLLKEGNDAESFL